jgi:hypothetical protein
MKLNICLDEVHTSTRCQRVPKIEIFTHLTNFFKAVDDPPPPPIVMPRFFSGSFLVLFIQKAFFTRILRSWSRQVGKK